MLVRLRNLNGTYYLVLKKEIREILEFGLVVELKIENGKLVISKAK